jgi:hypothetical protein
LADLFERSCVSETGEEGGERVDGFGFGGRQSGELFDGRVTLPSASYTVRVPVPSPLSTVCSTMLPSPSWTVTAFITQTS